MKEMTMTALLTFAQTLTWACVLCYLIREVFGYLTHRLDVLGIDLLRRRCDTCGDPVLARSENADTDEDAKPSIGFQSFR